MGFLTVGGGGLVDLAWQPAHVSSACAGFLLVESPAALFGLVVHVPWGLSPRSCCEEVVFLVCL